MAKLQLTSLGADILKLYIRGGGFLFVNGMKYPW